MEFMKRKQAKPYHHGDLANDIVRLAIPLLKKQGPHEFSFGKLADSLGVSHAAPYRHFKTREDLFSRIAMDGFEMLAKGLREIQEKYPLDPRGQLEESGKFYLSFVKNCSEHATLMFGRILKPERFSPETELGKRGRKAFDELLRIIRNCQLAGLVESHQAEELAVWTWSAVHGFSTLLCTGILRNIENLQPDSDIVSRFLSKLVFVS